MARASFSLAMIGALLSTAGCGGGGSGDTQTSQPPPPVVDRIAAGLYGVTINENAGAFNGHLVSAPTDEFIYVSKPRLGFGTWSYTSTGASATAALLARSVDSLGNEFPAAHMTTETRMFQLTRSGNAGVWAGGGTILTLDNRSAPNIATIPRNWGFRNLYDFNGVFLDYEVRIDIDSAGVLTGFDTNGCNFTGEITSRPTGEPFYDARVIATGCGATAQFIENAEYRGYAFIEPGPAANQTVLQIDVVNRTQQGGLGIAFSLFSR
jgi:hypothetical protein